MKHIDSKKAILALIIGVIPALVNGFVNQPFWRSFINTNFLCGLLMLAVGFFLYCRNQGDYDIMSYRPKDGVSYGEYRQQKATERETKPLPSLLVAAIIQLVYTVAIHLIR